MVFFYPVTLLTFSADQPGHSNNESTFQSQQYYKTLLTPLDHATLCGRAHLETHETDTLHTNPSRK